MRWHFAFLAFASLVTLQTCTNDAQFLCEEATARLADCCPGFDPGSIRCSSEGVTAGVAPSGMLPEEAKCMIGASCPALQTVCTRVAARAACPSAICLDDASCGCPSGCSDTPCRRVCSEGRCVVCVSDGDCPSGTVCVNQSACVAPCNFTDGGARGTEGAPGPADAATVPAGDAGGPLADGFPDDGGALADGFPAEAGPVDTDGAMGGRDADTVDGAGDATGDGATSDAEGGAASDGAIDAQPPRDASAVVFDLASPSTSGNGNGNGGSGGFAPAASGCGGASFCPLPPAALPPGPACSAAAVPVCP